MATLVISSMAFVASALTFLSGFGLGTLLMPVMAMFMPVEHAIALTAVVHFLSRVFKVALVGRRTHWPLVWRFGIPALLGSFLGAWALVLVAAQPPLASWTFGARVFHITVGGLVIGALLGAFVLFEWVPRWRARTFPLTWLPIGGLLSGFAGGMSGMQGALRSAFLARAGLTAESFVATGAVIACLVDVSRLGVYASSVLPHRGELDPVLLGVTVLAAFGGALLGTRLLARWTMEGIRHLVAVVLLIMAVAMGAGLL